QQEDTAARDERCSQGKRRNLQDGPSGVMERGLGPFFPCAFHRHLSDDAGVMQNGLYIIDPVVVAGLWIIGVFKRVYMDIFPPARGRILAACEDMGFDMVVVCDG